MSDIKCDFCGSGSYEILYRPIGTRRAANVVICNECELVYTITQDTKYSREPNVSGDADWGNVRFCKGQRFDAVKDMLPKDVKTILDVGSSRGHFVQWAKANIPGVEITAVEPDTRVIHEYGHEFRVIGKYLEEIELPDDYFDFVYCMQTLEHTNSASAMLRQIYKALRPGGVLFIEVPNIEVIQYPYNVEEFFIDKHNFHFNRTVLCNFMASLGYRIKVNSDNLNIRIFATKSDITDIHYAFMDNNPRVLIKDYFENIARNRQKLSTVGAKLNELNKKMKIVYWGANTLFDLLVKYGGLDTGGVSLLVDTYLHGLVDKVHGVKVQSVDTLHLLQPDTVVILARHSANDIEKIVRRYGVRNVIKFYDLIR